MFAGLAAGRAFGSILAVDIEVGQHVVRRIGGIALNLDTLWATGIAIAVVLTLGFVLRARVTSGVPGRIQVFWEALVDQTRGQVEGSVGSRGAAIVPLAICLFLLILIENWVDVLPNVVKPDIFVAPTADVDTTFAYALVVIILVHIASVRARGVKGYVSHYFKPYKALFPINLIEEIAKLFTLPLRLFGNMFAGGLMLTLIGALPLFFLPLSVPVATAWKVFDMGIGIIQAFIFALLTILYFGMAMEAGH